MEDANHAVIHLLKELLHQGTCFKTFTGVQKEKTVASRDLQKD